MIYDDILDKETYDNICKEIQMEYPYFNSFRTNKLAYSRYLSIGGKTRYHNDLEPILEFVDKTLPKIEKKQLEDKDLIRKWGSVKVHSLYLLKETYPEGKINWEKGTFKLN
tara:strand:+ start:480 stop:812 length:333 start_codon:yes stop_codon:yes gene_type:complete